jgi:hypothetical protein
MVLARRTQGAPTADRASMAARTPGATRVAVGAAQRVLVAAVGLPVGAALEREAPAALAVAPVAAVVGAAARRGTVPPMRATERMMAAWTRRPTWAIPTATVGLTADPPTTVRATTPVIPETTGADDGGV